MEELVIDTSVIVKWYAVPREVGFEQAKALLLDQTHQRSHLHVPLLALYEVGNAFLQFGTHLPIQEQLRHMADLFALGLSFYPLTLSRALMASELAAAFRVSFYDACFVALAQELAIPLVTADEQLCRRAASFPLIQRLASYSR